MFTAYAHALSNVNVLYPKTNTLSIDQPPRDRPLSPMFFAPNGAVRPKTRDISIYMRLSKFILGELTQTPSYNAHRACHKSYRVLSTL